MCQRTITLISLCLLHMYIKSKVIYFFLSKWLIVQTLRIRHKSRLFIYKIKNRTFLVWIYLFKYEKGLVAQSVCLGYLLGNRARARDFSLSHHVQISSGTTQTPVRWVLEGKADKCETGHSHPSNAKVKNEWIYTATSHMSSWHGA
jgi:hypothetical protein